MDTRYRGQKRQLSASRIKVNFPKQDNSKVKVQYIENHQIVEKKNICRTLATAPPSLEDPEIEGENVEYLDESVSEDQSIKIEQSNKYNSETTPCSVFQSAKKPFKDTFYPNAIHCLIDLYKRKYVEMKGKNKQQIQSMNVWDHIAEDMNECLFHFDSSHIREKFKQLRRQYFGVTNSQEADEFEYFDQLHDLYQDKYIDAIAAGVFRRGESEEKQETVYCDEVVLVDDEEVVGESDKHLEMQEMQHFKTTVALEPKYQADAAQEVDVHINNDDEIAHKEHEFIDMVEKELQAIVDGVEDNGGAIVHEVDNNEMIVHQQEEVVAHQEFAACTTELERNIHSVPSLQTVFIKCENQEEEPIKPKNAKRFKVDMKPNNTAPHVVRLHVSPVPQSQHQNGGLPVAKKIAAEENTEITLAYYNAQQERRHREKLQLLQRSLLLQERAVEMHRHFMEELIKRL